jgi:hypothetical protein
MPTQISAPVMLPGGGFQFTFSGSLGNGYLIQASGSLVDWVTLQTNGSFSGQVFFHRHGRDEFKPPILSRDGG